MPTLTNHGVEIYYEVAGTGPTVVLSHAFGQSSGMWRDQVPALRDRYRVITWDMRGHGRSGCPDAAAAYSRAMTCSDLAALLDNCGAEGAVLGGLSLGGYTSLAFYLAFPERVRALMLFDTGPGFRDPVARDRWNAAAVARAEAIEGEARSAGASPEDRDSQAYRSARGLALAARGMLAQFDSTVIEGLERIAVPTLVVVGEHDRPLRSAADYLTSRIQGSSGVVIEGAGHLSNLDQPAAFNTYMLDFLDRISIGVS
jgi:pimeloyl-ACP methyl ester carboxylesterase